MTSNAIPMTAKRYQCDTCAKQFDIYSTFYSHCNKPRYVHGGDCGFKQHSGF